VLDAARAARVLLGDDSSAVTALFGHSQGGHAVVFATELAASYAPDLELMGAAPMAPPTALGELLERDQREPAGIPLTALAVTSWSQLYAEAREDGVVHPEARRFVASIGRRCIATTVEALADLPDVVAVRLEFLSAEPATAPGWSQHLRANAPTTLPDDVPVLVAQGLADDIVRPAVTEAFVRDRCAAGARIELETYPGVDHFGIPTAAVGEVTGWLLERLQGAPTPRGCVTERR
jgi:hypothetical protein